MARIREEKDSLELETILSVFAGYVFDIELIKGMMKWEVEFMKESPLMKALLTQEFEKGVQEGHQEGRQKGLGQGLEKGQYKAKREALGQILSIRFELPLTQYDHLLEDCTLADLDKLTELALRAKIPLEFEQSLKDTFSTD